MTNLTPIENLPLLGHFINGQHVVPQERELDVINPANAKVERRVCLASIDTMQIAIRSAQRAFPDWRATRPAKRAQIMFAYKQLLEANADRIASAISREHGKIIDDAMGEFRRGVEIVDFACGAPQLLKGEHSKDIGPNMDSWSEHHPLGVVAGITPFNFPAMVPMWMFPMAIVCGNCFILKPSEKDPSVALILADLLSQAGLPDGVFNVVNGDKEAVNALLEHKNIEAISFVGSTPIAEYIYATGTKNGKRVQALGGAKNHAIVMPDADIDNAVNALMGAAYGSCGERCMAISVAVCVGDDIADDVVSQLKTRVAALKIGAGDNVDNDMGPLISKEHLAKVISYVDLGVTEGATLVSDGRGFCLPDYAGGYFLGGCLFDHVTQDMRIYKEEIFGPVLCVVRVKTQQEAMRLINDHEFGNGTCIFTRDGEAARYFTDNIKVGMVGVNTPLPVPAAFHSFGGWKRSLFGDLYAYGPDAVRFYTRRKTVTQKWVNTDIQTQFAFK